MSHNRLHSAVGITSILRLPEYVEREKPTGLVRIMERSRFSSQHSMTSNKIARKYKENEAMRWRFFSLLYFSLVQSWCGWKHGRKTGIRLFPLWNRGREGATGPRDGSDQVISSVHRGSVRFHSLRKYQKERGVYRDGGFQSYFRSRVIWWLISIRCMWVDSLVHDTHERTVGPPWLAPHLHGQVDAHLVGAPPEARGEPVTTVPLRAHPLLDAWSY